MTKISKITEIESIQEESLDEFLNMKKELPEERPRGLTCFRRPDALAFKMKKAKDTFTNFLQTH